MYPGEHVSTRSDQPALIMSGTGETISYAALEARTNRLSHLLRKKELNREDHYAIFMEINARYVETCGVGERAGLDYTCVNSSLTADELAYILNNSESKLLITSKAKRDVALAALPRCPNVASCRITDGPGNDAAVFNLDEATAGRPDIPIVAVAWRRQGSQAEIMAVTAAWT
jgi:long-chain acyl-CoA synthetase